MKKFICGILATCLILSMSVIAVNASSPDSPLTADIQSETSDTSFLMTDDLLYRTSYTTVAATEH